MTFRLPRLPPAQPNWLQMQIWWQQVVIAVEAHESSLEQQLADIRATQRRDAISASFAIPTLIATASDAGADSTIAIAAHVRHYGDESSVSVSSGSLTGQPYSTDVAIYYDDAARAGGAVVYHATTDLKTAQNNYVAGRHYVATVTTPASGGAAVTGGTPPPGSGYRGSNTVSGFDIP